MVESTRNRYQTRLLCLGNDILADDAFGLVVADELRGRASRAHDIVASAESGLRLLDYLLGVSRVVVIDTVQTGKADPGTVHVMTEEDVSAMSSGSPHYVGLFEALALGRRLELPVAKELIILAIEAADCVTIGGDMHPSVRAAIPRVVEMARELMG
jgi:hydrogenase maturation protease